MSSRLQPLCRSTADLRHLCRCQSSLPEGAFANANWATSPRSPFFCLYFEVLGGSRGGVLIPRQFPTNSSSRRNRRASRTFIVLRFLWHISGFVKREMSRLCVFQTPQGSGLQGVCDHRREGTFTWSSLPSFKSHSRFQRVFSGLLRNCSLFTLAYVCFWFGTVPRSPSPALSLFAPPPVLRAKWMFLIVGRLECLLLPSRL